MTEKSLVNEDLADLAYAKRLLEHPSLAARIASAVGTPIEKGFGLLPRGAAAAISAATRKKRAPLPKNEARTNGKMDI